jgi:hypothetical protein
VKVNLLLNSPDIRSDYLNIDPYADPADRDKVTGSLINLDEHVDDGEAVDLLALDIIDYIGSNETNEAIASWLKKLRHGGTITIGGIDLRGVSHAFLHHQISLTEANILLYGAQDAPYNYRKATLTIQHVIDMMIEQDLKVLRKQIQQYKYFVTARRP